MNNIKLIQARRRRGLNQKELAEAAGISRKALCEYESGKCKPSHQTIDKLRVGLYKDPEIISDEKIQKALNASGWSIDTKEGRLMLLELLSKASAGYYNSHTEEAFLNSFNLLRYDRTPNRKGCKFICSMVYESSCRRPKAYDLMKRYRAGYSGLKED